MTSCARVWVPAVIAMLLFASACGDDDDSVGDGGEELPDDGVRDAGEEFPDDALRDASQELPVTGAACRDEGLLYCWTPNHQCCHGVWITFNDGACQPGPDAGVPNCTAQPTAWGCSCTVGDAPPVCAPFSRPAGCVGGVWTPKSTHGCCL